MVNPPGVCTEILILLGKGPGRCTEMVEPPMAGTL